MRSKRFLQDQRQLLDHAEEARTRAEAMTDADSKIRMLGIAEGYEKQARQEKTLAGVKFNPKLDVEVTSDSIVITLLGTIYSVTYFMRMGSSGLLARDIANKDDPRVSMKCPDFLASAWRAANDRAKGLGWIA
jgi:hypothetical protein